MVLSTAQFYIPLHREDLRKAQHQQQIVVEEVYSEKQTVSLLDGLKDKLRTCGPECIYEDLDLLYSILHHFESLKPDTKELAWKCLIKIVRKLTDHLRNVLNNSGQRLEMEVRVKNLNMTKMSVFFLCQLIDCYESEATKPSGIAITEKGRRKAKKSSNDAWWEINREEGLSALSKLTSLPLNRLWDPPTLEEEFISLINSGCFKILENPSSVKSRATKDAIMSLLGFSFSKFGHTLGLSLKIIQLLQHYEHLAVPLAEVVEFLVREHGHKNIVPEIIRETGRIDGKDLARDSAGTRALAQFLVELSIRIPAVVLPSVSLLLTFLDGEAYSMRNCVLSIMGEIVLRSLSCENMDSKTRKDREQLLDRLEDHIHDVNAFVRSRALQIWCNLCKEKVIPLSRQHQLLRLITGRLYDKSCQVRKHSIHFLTDFLQGNPFTAKLSLKELQENFKKEKEKLDTLMEECESSETNQLVNGEQCKSSKWDTIEGEVRKAMEEFEDMEPNSPLLNEESVFLDVLKSIGEKLEGGQFIQAIQMVFEAKELFSREDIFNLNNEEPVSDEEFPESLAIMKRIYTGWSLPELEKTVLENPTSVSAEEEANSNGVVNEVSKQQVLVQYLKDCVQFAEQIQASIPAVAHLLASKTPSDILEAINFFVTAYEFGVQEALLGVRKMLLLIWCRETSVKEAVVAAYKRLYLSPPSKPDSFGPEEVAYGLMNLLRGLSLGELASLEELICDFVRTGELSKTVFNIWWDLFSMKKEQTSQVESHSALILLGMAGKAENDIVLQNLDLLIMSGLNERAEPDLLFTKDVFSALLKVPGSGSLSVESKSPPYRMSADHPLFERLTEIIVNSFTGTTNPYWTPMVQQAVKVIYKLSEHPDTVVERLIAQLLEKAGSQVKDGESSQETGGEISCVSLSRLFSLVGEIAQAQLVHLDLSVYTELKRRQCQKEAKQQRKERKASKHKRRSALAVDPQAKATETDIDIEMGLVGAEADDNEADFISKVCETELLREDGLLFSVCPLLVDVCSHPAKYQDQKTCISASLTLAKLMMISSSFCEKHLALLVTILDKSQDPVIRGNTIIALGDLSIRFPNLVEPWTPQLYARLRDSSEVVRKNTLLVLTHLILNDLIKVKSQISEVALCIVDKDEKVKKMVKTLFNELAKKGNALYNILPDIISRLSDPECGTEENNFRTILKFLLSFIDKDKQLECLVEKLCIRFNSTRAERQDRDLAYCLSLIPCNERCIRKLHENVACFAEKLKDKSVYESFTFLVNGARKGTNLKPELKTSIDELEKIIEELHLKGESEENVVQKAKQANAKLKGKVAPRTAAKSTRKRKEKFADSSNSSEEENEQQPKNQAGGKAKTPFTVPSTRKHRSAPKKSKLPILAFSDSEDELPLVNGKSDIENEEPVQTPLRRSCRRK